MDAALVEALNQSVRKRDLLYHIGDFCGPFAEGRDVQVDHAEKIRRAIRCKSIRLVCGNHDPKGARFKSLFDKVRDQYSLRAEHSGERLLLSHYPLRAWRGQMGGAMHLYGHTHGALEELGRSMDVGVDCWNYSPLRLSHAIDLLAARPVSAPDGWVRRQKLRMGAVGAEGSAADHGR